MSRTTHAAAVLEEDGEPIAVVVKVDVDLLDHIGDETVYDTVTNHPWVQDQGVPLVLGFKADGDLNFVGPEDLSDFVADCWGDLKWKSKISIDWEEIDEGLDEDFDDEEDDDEDDEYEDDDEYDGIDDDIDEDADEDVVDDEVGDEEEEDD